MDVDFLSDLKNEMIKIVYGKPSQMVSSLTYDSKKVDQNTAFFCINGQTIDGHQFIVSALKQGASVIIGTNSRLLKQFSNLYLETTFIAVDNAKSFMAEFAAFFYKENYTRLATFAVTGTNGKTTVVAYIRSLLNQLSIPTGSIGTAGIWDDKTELKLSHSTHTTPEVIDLYKAFDSFTEHKLEAAAIEVTSIALEQKRVEGILFDVGIHTNLTPEHLDFHPSFEAYKQAKLKLFQQVKAAVVNLDDPGMSSDILSTFDGPTLTYSLEKSADVSASHIKIQPGGTCFDLKIKGYTQSVSVPAYGEFNISNLLAAICACVYLSIPPKLITKAIKKVDIPAGRFELLRYSTDYTIILDFAHTPSGLENVVKAAQQLPHKRLILLITGVGLRDPGQRPQLASAVEGKADEIIVSVDHPDFFDRQTIANDVLKGFSEEAAAIKVVLEREEAIYTALSLAQKDDIVLLTGLGSGGYQVIEGQQIPYSDKEVIQRYFKE